jgi:hypothetical protein
MKECGVNNKEYNMNDPKEILNEQINKRFINQKYLKEAKPPKGTLYVHNSSIFDAPANKYDIPLFMKTLKKAGAKKVWKANAYGWSNQPEVVLFQGLDREKARKVLGELPVFQKWGAIIHDTDDWE